MFPAYRRTVWGIALLTAVFALSACQLPEPAAKHAKRKTTLVKPAAAKNRAADFIENLSLARLDLMAGTDEAGVAASAAALKSYGHQRKPKAERLTLVVLDFIPKGNSQTQKVIAAAEPLKTECSSLQRVMDRLLADGGVLENMHIVHATVRPDAAQEFSGDAGVLRVTLDEIQHGILQRSETLPVAEDMALHLSLLRFFTEHNDRDAAYLALANSKQLLARASEERLLGTEALTSFALQIENAETALKKTIPYTF